METPQRRDSLVTLRDGVQPTLDCRYRTATEARREEVGEKMCVRVRVGLWGRASTYAEAS